jgi:hypothetical protein
MNVPAQWTAADRQHWEKRARQLRSLIIQAHRLGWWDAVKRYQQQLYAIPRQLRG